MIGVKKFPAPGWNIKEILRYARAKDADDVIPLVRECMSEAEGVLTYQVSFDTFAIERVGDTLSFGMIQTASSGLRKAIDGCEQLVLFAATVGTPFDRLIQKYSRLSPAKALILHAIGAERVEALCDRFVGDYAAEHSVVLKPRVSPGYGDIPLGMQRDIFKMLDCSRKIGLTLNENLLMSPSKSVTAIAGIRDRAGDTLSEFEDCLHQCDRCDHISCVYREG